jgi:hypothetical protein
VQESGESFHVKDAAFLLEEFPREEPGRAHGGETGMVATDNLVSLHKHEEELRAKSLATIQADEALSDHWNLVAEAMNAIYAFTHDHVHGSDNELTQYLCIRLFNAAGDFGQARAFGLGFPPAQGRDRNVFPGRLPLDVPREDRSMEARR